MGIERLGMELAAAIDHRMDRQQRRALAAEMALDLGQRAHRERRGDHRHDDQIGGAHHLLARLGEPGRAIEQHPLIAVGERAKDPRGQTAAEYMGVLLLVAAIITVVITAGVGKTIKDTIIQQINDIKGSKDACVKAGTC